MDTKTQSYINTEILGNTYFQKVRIKATKTYLNFNTKLINEDNSIAFFRILTIPVYTIIGNLVSLMKTCKFILADEVYENKRVANIIKEICFKGKDPASRINPKFFTFQKLLFQKNILYDFNYKALLSQTCFSVGYIYFIMSCISQKAFYNKNSISNSNFSNEKNENLNKSSNGLFLYSLFLGLMYPVRFAHLFSLSNKLLPLSNYNNYKVEFDLNNINNKNSKQSILLFILGNIEVIGILSCNYLLSNFLIKNYLKINLNKHLNDENPNFFSDLTNFDDFNSRINTALISSYGVDYKIKILQQQDNIKLKLFSCLFSSVVLATLFTPIEFFCWSKFVVNDILNKKNKTSKNSGKNDFKNMFDVSKLKRMFVNWRINLIWYSCVNGLFIYSSLS